MADPLETAELLAFTKTVESQSVSRAAEELRVPRATVSRRLARLEERLGARLLRRTTRSLRLTDAGEALYRHARIALDAVTQAEASVRADHDAVRGDLRVSVPPLSSPSFNEMVCDFVRKYPEVRLQVHATSKYIDLQRDGYDLALRASTAMQPGLVARPIMRDPVLAVASPAYLARRGLPKTRKDVAQHDCLLAFERGELPQTHWPLGGGRKMHVTGHLCTNDINMLRDAAVAGLGIALLPYFLVEDMINQGKLVHVLGEVIRLETMVAIVYPERELVPPQVRLFIEAIAAWATKEYGPLDSRKRPKCPTSVPRLPARSKRES
ncbi:MAG: LysR family transcriptional regulator [Polyangiaceae bacterium]